MGVIIMKRTIYFDTLRSQFSEDAKLAISDITHSTIDVVDSWPALMSLLCQELCHDAWDCKRLCEFCNLQSDALQSCCVFMTLQRRKDP